MIKLRKEDLVIGACASKEKTRYALNGVRVEGNRFIATDGRIVATKEVDEAEEGEAVENEKKDYLIPLEAWKGIKPGPGLHTADVTANGKVTVKDSRGETSFNELEGTFPDWKEILEKVSNQKTIGT